MYIDRPHGKKIIVPLEQVQWCFLQIQEAAVRWCVSRWWITTEMKFELKTQTFFFLIFLKFLPPSLPKELYNFLLQGIPAISKSSCRAILLLFYQVCIALHFIWTSWNKTPNYKPCCTCTVRCSDAEVFTKSLWTMLSALFQQEGKDVWEDTGELMSQQLCCPVATPWSHSVSS